MQTASIHRISFIGSGNVAMHLAAVLQQKGKEIVQVYSSNSNNRQLFAKRFSCQAADNLSSIDQKSDLYVIAVPDDQIVEVMKGFPNIDGIVVHASGFTSIKVLDKMKHFGVIYPLQTFTTNIEVDWQKVPICIESSDKIVGQILEELTLEISEKVIGITSDQRKVLHLSAVIVNNFSNHLYSQAFDLLKSNNLSFDLLLPLIAETARKITIISPVQAQTGPARRNDNFTIQNQLKMLKDFPEIKEIYQIMSDQIGKKYNE